MISAVHFYAWLNHLTLVYITSSSCSCSRTLTDFSLKNIGIVSFELFHSAVYIFITDIWLSECIYRQRNIYLRCSYWSLLCIGQGYYRRGVANYGLKNFDMALKDFTSAVKLSPKNRVWRGRIADCEKELERIRSTNAPSVPVSFQLHNCLTLLGSLCKFPNQCLQLLLDFC